jgi:hypothetical protein
MPGRIQPLLFKNSGLHCGQFACLCPAFTRKYIFTILLGRQEFIGDWAADYEEVSFVLSEPSAVAGGLTFNK